MNIKEKIKAAYDQLAESYNALIDHKPHNAYYDRPNTLSLLSEVEGKAILDAACGPGKYAEILLAKGAHVTGFDISPKMIELARSRNEGRGTFFVRDLVDPLDDIKEGTFDIVLCALALHYIEDWTTTIQTFRRVLKTSGSLVISIEHPFFEYTYFKSQNYFETEHVACTWRGFGKPVEVNSYRRPLSACLMPLIQNGFNISNILEPKPVEAFQKLDPKHYKELNEFPAFICIKADKK